MALIHEMLSDQFYDWEERGRGWTVWALPVSPEPPFRPFYGHHVPEAPLIDDGRRPTFLNSFVDKLTQKMSPQPPPVFIQESKAEPEPRALIRDPMVELQTSLPAKLDITKEAFEHFLRSLTFCREPVAFELIGTPGQVRMQFAAQERDAPLVRRQLQAYFPEAVFQPCDGTLEASWETSESEAMLVVEFGLEREFMFPLATGKLDPFIGIIGALSELRPGEVGLFQVLFEPAREEWAESIVNSVTGDGGKPFFVNMPELAAEGENKVKCPLYAAVVRIAVKSETYDGAVEIARDLAGSLRVFAHPEGNKLIPLHNDDYPFEDHVEDMLRRQSHRSGMLLNSDELIGFVHLPSSAVRSQSLERDTGKTKAAPSIARNASGMLLGSNVHFGESIPVRLTPEQRVQHMHVIGASGSGKSTLLFNLIRQNIENGEGVALLDPHGDLVESLLGIIPQGRVNDVVLIDPSDEEYSVGFNFLSAHSDLEKTLLASDLISVFQRLSTSWGDQMGIVLQNAILAFLESDQGGTLADLRRFLVEPAFRDKFLTTVRDPDIVYYWRKAFAQLTGNKSIGPALTRLETFLAPKPIRYMVTQKENRLNFGDIMDSGKIFLAKLPLGQMGKENAFLLGSLLVGKFQQLAMGRQVQRIESRRPFFLYIDEVQNFITPSMAEILSGARKYRLGLVLAHQELHHLDRDRDVASAVLSNPYTRVVFRVGDADAKKLAEGFSFFEARDLQNLEPGHAICRVEKANGDFNLSVPLPAMPSRVDAAERRQQVITASREKYATSRKDIEATLRSSASKEPETAQIPPLQKPSTLEDKQLILPQEPKKEADVVSSTSESTDENIPLHQVLKERIVSEGERLGFTASMEEAVPKGRADVHLERGPIIIACEVSFTTSRDHELGNVRKCLNAGYVHVAAICTEAKRLASLKKYIEAAIEPEELAKVHFYSPADFISSLEQIAKEAPGIGTPKAPKQAIKFAINLTDDERKNREREMLKILSENMKSNAKKKT
jgi:hypothetical protein